MEEINHFILLLDCYDKDIVFFFLLRQTYKYLRYYEDSQICLLFLKKIDKIRR